MDAHAERVRQIAADAKGFHDTKQRWRINHGSTNSTRNQSTKGMSVIDTSKMNHILSIDTEKLSILVEPNVPMDRLIEATLAHDLIPSLVIDFPASLPVQRFSASTDPWFYTHVQARIGHSKGPVVELIPVPEYLFRYDRGSFWVGESILRGDNGACGAIPNIKWTRKLLDPLLHTRMLYAAVHAGGFNGQIIQDIVVPYSVASKFLGWVATEVQVWPLWLCPVRYSANPTLHPFQNPIQSSGPQPQMLNIGVWGAPKVHTFEYWIEINQRLESKLREVGGMKWMYGFNLENDEEF
ncbi:hypothetical protein DOTSEDRAFT_82730 [Dothistroma septosporum NZE10]|uniref:FAD linked oxidase N-terminal domain-containing protein n=1 Tax=Dothistroma septosporum (strain NZE10 / CBS 128990) TaxID=675120 RepID=N1PFD7_DOTSN|nr:hypothetical protein DOTSEDRAFT_82730 [Dothistroma septosporum NZE10]